MSTGEFMQLAYVLALAIGIAGCQTNDEKNVKLETQKDKVSYSIGLSVGRSLLKDSISINPDAFLRGVDDAGKDSAGRLLTDDQIREAMQTLQEEVNNRMMASQRAVSEKNRAACSAFLAENAKKEGVVSLPSGLQYRIITAGKGKKPTATSTVTTHYRGHLIDGTEFDSSYRGGEPVTFQVNEMIRGWSEALQLMPVGSKWELFIPTELAYGDRTPGELIPPGSLLIFELELLSTK